MKQVKFILNHPDAKLPKQGREGDTGFDVFAVEDKIIPAYGHAVVDTGITVADCPADIWFKVEARSGLGFKHGILPHPGIIDATYRGQAAVRLNNITNVEYHVKKGDRIAQFVFYPVVVPQILEAETATETKRGAGGFGSSGR